MKVLTRAMVPVVLMFLVIGCCSGIQKKAIDQLDNTHELIVPEYLQYVAKDEALTDKDKEDRQKLVESMNHIMVELKKQVE